MLRVEDFEFLSFFGCEPEPQPQDEREFFDNLTFLKDVEGVRLKFSVSQHFHDLRVSLSPTVGNDLLEYELKGIEGITFEPDADLREWMRVQSKSGGEVSISVRPTIKIRISCGQD